MASGPSLRDLRPRAPSRARVAALRTGFTLLELLVVIAILIAVAAGVVVSLDDTQTQAMTDVTHYQLSEVQRAIVQFRVDTGYMPRCGPFDLSASVAPGRNGNVGLNELRHVITNSSLAAMNSVDLIEWFDAPANLWQLMVNPLASVPPTATDHPLSRWNPDTHRGWRGPYLRAETWLVARSGLHADGSLELGLAHWPMGTVPLIPAPFPCVADPFRSLDRVLTWVEMPSGDVLDHDRVPVLLIDVANPRRARVVSPGPNGRYEPVVPDSSQPQELWPCTAGDDLGRFVLR